MLGCFILLLGGFTFVLSFFIFYFMYLFVGEFVFDPVSVWLGGKSLEVMQYGLVTAPVLSFFTALIPTILILRQQASDQQNKAEAEKAEIQPRDPDLDDPF